MQQIRKPLRLMRIQRQLLRRQLLRKQLLRKQLLRKLPARLSN